jgi:hypothetical protein
MATLYVQPFDIPKTYYRAIGEVIARRALFDFHVMLAIGQLLKIQNPKQVRVSFMGMAAKAKLGALKALATNWSPTPAIRTELHAIVREALRITDTRNSFAHGRWGHPANSKRLVVIYAEEGKDFYMPKAKRYTSAEITAKAAELRALNKRLWAVIEQLKSSPA